MMSKRKRNWTFVEETRCYRTNRTRYMRLDKVDGHRDNVNL
jgi:hypothetical protein